jgi:hypothetical protein
MIIMQIINCLLVFILQIFMSYIRVWEIKHCYDNNRRQMAINAFYGSLITLVSFTIGVAPLIKMLNDDSHITFLNFLAPISFIVGSVIGKVISFEKIEKKIFFSIFFRIFVLKSKNKK